MHKISYSRITYHFNEVTNELVEKFESKFFDVPVWGLIWRWALYFLGAIVTSILLLIPFFVTKKDIFITFEIFILLYFTISLSFILEGVQDYCDKYTLNSRHEWYEELNQLEKEQLQKCIQWRQDHPLEEKCRLALTKNPNMIADLIRYVEEIYCSKQ